MSVIDRSLLRKAEILIAALVLLIAVVSFSDLPQPYPAWPTIAGIPVNAELVIPGLLALVVLLDSITEGLTVGSVVLGALGLGTLWLATSSIYSLYTAEGGGVFWGGFFTLLVGIVLAGAVLIRIVARRWGPNTSRYLAGRLGL